MSFRRASETALALLLTFAAHDVKATSLKILEPLAGIDTVAMSIMIGGPLGLSGGVELLLFQGDVQRSANFKKELEDQVTLLLHSYGVTLASSNEAEILVHIYGRPVRNPDEDHYYVFLLVVSLPARNGTETGLDEELIPSTAIDVTTEKGLEVALTKSVIGILKEKLEDAGKERLASHWPSAPTGSSTPASPRSARSPSRSPSSTATNRQHRQHAAIHHRLPIQQPRPGHQPHLPPLRRPQQLLHHTCSATMRAVQE